MIHFDEPRQAMHGPRPRDGEGQNGKLPDNDLRAMDGRQPDDAPAIEDGIWYVSPPPAPFPRVFPGL